MAGAGLPSPACSVLTDFGGKVFKNGCRYEFASATLGSVLYIGGGLENENAMEVLTSVESLSTA